MNSDLKHCPLCNNDLPVAEFGICRARKDGRNLYCKACIRDKVNASRRLLKQMIADRKEAREYFKVERKPMVVSPTVGTPVTRVCEALKQGHHTRDQIKSATRLPWDDLCDALAVLSYDYESVQSKRVEGEAYFYLRKIA